MLACTVKKSSFFSEPQLGTSKSHCTPEHQLLSNELTCFNSLDYAPWWSVYTDNWETDIITIIKTSACKEDFTP